MPTRVSSPAKVFPDSLEQIPPEMRVEYYGAGSRYLINGQVRELAARVAAASPADKQTAAITRDIADSAARLAV